MPLRTVLYPLTLHHVFHLIDMSFKDTIGQIRIWNRVLVGAEIRRYGSAAFREDSRQWGWITSTSPHAIMSGRNPMWSQGSPSICASGSGILRLTMRFRHSRRRRIFLLNFDAIGFPPRLVCATMELLRQLLAKAVLLGGFSVVTRRTGPFWAHPPSSF